MYTIDQSGIRPLLGQFTDIRMVIVIDSIKLSSDIKQLRVSCSTGDPNRSWAFPETGRYNIGGYWQPMATGAAKQNNSPEFCFGRPVSPCCVHRHHQVSAIRRPGLRWHFEVAPQFLLVSAQAPLGQKT